MSYKPLVFAVDDEKDMRHVYLEMLKKDYELCFYETGADLLAMIEKQVPDLLLIDVGLKDMDGYELCEKVKQDARMDNVPVIFVTGRDFSEDNGRTFLSGAEEYVMKPVDTEDFKQLASRVISEHSDGTSRRIV